MTLLQDKVALITGSSRGFGFAVAKAYLEQGARVVISSRSKEAIDIALEKLKFYDKGVIGFSCDVAYYNQVQALADKSIENFGQIDIWVNNAALSAPYGPSIQIDPKEFERITRTNMLGTYYGSIVAMRHFLQRKEGKLINILGRGDRQFQPMQNAYAASKAWIISFTRALAEEYKESGVGVYAFNPGMMDTDLLKSVKVISGYENRLDNLGNVIYYLSQPAEIPARKAVSLASSQSDNRTGVVLREMKMSRLFLNLMRMGWARMRKRSDKAVKVDISSVPPAFPQT